MSDASVRQNASKQTRNEEYDHDKRKRQKRAQVEIEAFPFFAKKTGGGETRLHGDVVRDVVY